MGRAVSRRPLECRQGEGQCVKTCEHASMSEGGWQPGAVLGDYQFEGGVRATAQRRTRAMACRHRRAARAFWRGVRSTHGPPGLDRDGPGMRNGERVEDSAGGGERHGAPLDAEKVEPERCEGRHGRENCWLASEGSDARHVASECKDSTSHTAERCQGSTDADMTISEFLRVAKDIKRRLPHLPDERVGPVPMLLDAPTTEGVQNDVGALSSEDQGVALEVVENMERVILRELSKGHRSGAQLIAASIEEYESTLIDETDDGIIEEALMGYQAAAEIAIRRLINFGQIRPQCSAVDIMHAEYNLCE